MLAVLVATGRMRRRLIRLYVFFRTLDFVHSMKMRLVAGMVCLVSVLQAQAEFSRRRQPPGQNTDAEISRYEKQIASGMRDVRTRLLLAKTYIQKVRESADFSYLERASHLVDEVLRADPGNYPAMRQRSEIELERHNFAQVLEYSEALTILAPDDPWNWGTLGDAAMELGRYEQASTSYARMVALRADLASYNRLAYHRFVTGDARGAIEAMERAIAAGSPSPEHVAWCLVDLGAMQFKLGRLEEAERAFQSALATFPGYPAAHAGLGRLRAAQGKAAEAIRFFVRAQAAVPLPEVAAALEALYTESGKPAEAARQRDLIDLIDRMEKAGGEKTNRNLAMIYADRDRKLDRAMELIEAELKVRNDVYTSDALAWVLFKNKQRQKAREASRQALRFETPEPAFHYHAGMIEAALGNREEARRRLARALELNPRFDPVQAERALSALRELER
ncbi:MAG: tetratricopeptide repeat protein [Bryobacteraceae bacterium]